MPHLSDGELHAYLDGALEHLPRGRAEEIREHLRTCEACRSRLAGEQELLERSGAILDAGAPASVEAPPLEELRERARIREERAAEERRRPWRAMPRTQVLAWAATVVLALGIGWVTRDLTGVRSPMGRPEMEAVGAPAGAAAPDGADERAEVAEEDVANLADQDGAESAGEGSGAGAASDRFEDRPPPPEAETRPPAATRSGAAAPEREAAPPSAEEPAGEPAHEAGVAGPVVARDEAGPSRGATVTGRVVDEASSRPLGGASVLLEDSAGVIHTGTLTRADGRFVLNADRPGSYRAVVRLIGYGSTGTELFKLSPDDTVSREIRTSAEAVALDAITVQGIVAEEGKGAEGAALRMAPEPSAADAAAGVGEAEELRSRLRLDGLAATPELLSSHVPGLPVLRIDPQTEPLGFVIVQRLANGDTLHLRWIAGSAVPGDVAPGAGRLLESLPEGWSQVLVRRGNGWLVARARLPEAEIRALLDRPR